MTKKLCLLLFFTFLSSLLYAQNRQIDQIDSVIILNNSRELKMIGKQIYFLEDENANFTIIDVLKSENQAKFQRHTKDVFSNLVSPKAFWFKIILQNKTQEPVWLEVGGSFACWEIDFYRPDSTGNYANPTKTGALRPNTQKEYPVNFYWLKLADGQQTDIRTYYVRVTSGMPHEYPLQAGTILALSKNKEGYDYLIAGFAGLMLIMFFYNLFIYVTTKQKLYLYYILYLLFTGYDVIFDNNYAFFTQNTWHWDYFFAWHSIAFLFTGLFGINYLNLSKAAPPIYKFVWGVLFVLIVIIPILSIVGVPHYMLMYLDQPMIGVFYFSLFYAGIALWKKGNQDARFYVLGWSFAIVGVFVMLAVINGLIPFNMFTRSALCFGFSLEVLMFSLALGDKMNQMRKQVLKSQAELLKITTEQNTILEIKVQERTNELEVQNEEIRQQQEELMMLNENLTVTTDRLEKSIRYAQNIQKVILPEEANLYSYFEDYFAIYLPKDIVSGDFYWFSKLSQTQAIFILADCTGHGVPGAFMTMIGNTLLHEIINKNKITSPSKILKELGNDIQVLLKQKQDKNADGMDLTICLFEKINDNIQLTLSGVKSTTFYSLGNGEIGEFKGSRGYIGGKHSSQEDFVEQIVYLQNHDIIYFASDGFADQNNEERVKFGSKNLKELIKDSTNKPLAEQKNIFLKALSKHQNRSEQRDDIALIALKVNCVV